MYPYDVSPSLVSWVTYLKLGKGGGMEGVDH